MTLGACLPTDMQGPNTSITRIAAGLSGAGVHRVDVAGQAFVLKIARDDEPLDLWRGRTRVLQLAADAGLAARVIHIDESRRAVLSAFVADRSFPALCMHPRTRESAIALLGRTIRRVHDLPLPPNADAQDPRGLLATTWQMLAAGGAVPSFAGDAVRQALEETAPISERAFVLSHNDVNPTNLVYDGEKLLLLDWDSCGSNDPLWDLASISVFLRMDAETCRALIAAHDGEPAASIPKRFSYNRRLVAVLMGAVFLGLARQHGHTGGNGALESAGSLLEFYQRMRAGTISPASAEGQWAFGLALVKEAVAMAAEPRAKAG